MQKPGDSHARKQRGQFREYLSDSVRVASACYRRGGAQALELAVYDRGGVVSFATSFV